MQSIDQLKNNLYHKKLEHFALVDKMTDIRNRHQQELKEVENQFSLVNTEVNQLETQLIVQELYTLILERNPVLASIDTPSKQRVYVPDSLTSRMKTLYGESFPLVVLQKLQKILHRKIERQCNNRGETPHIIVGDHVSKLLKDKEAELQQLREDFAMEF